MYAPQWFDPEIPAVYNPPASMLVVCGQCDTQCYTDHIRRRPLLRTHVLASLWSSHVHQFDLTSIHLYGTSKRKYWLGLSQAAVHMA